MESQPSASEQADRAIERMRVREAEVMGHRLAALEAMRAQAQAQGPGSEQGSLSLLCGVRCDKAPAPRTPPEPCLCGVHTHAHTTY